MLQNTGAVVSIAFVLAIVTSSVPKETLFAIFSGVATGLSEAKLDPFIHNMHTALWVLAATLRARRHRVLLRPKETDARFANARCGSASWPRLAGTTPRTVRYYEEIGLLARPRSAAPASTAPTRRPTSRA
jgi:hypothetical protein